MRGAQMLAGSLLAAMGSLGATQPSLDEERSMREDAMLVAKMAAGFVTLAGSEDNAAALVESLREGAAVQLSYPGATPEAMPQVFLIETPTPPMEWHDVRMTLMLARDALMAFGVLRPSGEQLQASLLGGTAVVTGGRVVEFRGVLRMRADGFHWGRIASERFQRPAVVRID